MYHDPTSPVYEVVPSDDGRVHIRTPDDSLEKATKSRLSRRNRALLAVAAKRGEVDLSKWSSADLAKLFGASPRSVSAASQLSSKELQDVANERRPLFPQRSSVPAPSPVFNLLDAATLIVREMHENAALNLLADEYDRYNAAIAKEPIDKLISEAV